MVQVFFFLVALAVTSLSQQVPEAQSDPLGYGPDGYAVVPWHTTTVPQNFTRINNDALSADLDDDIRTITQSTQHSKIPSPNQKLAEYQAHFLNTYPGIKMSYRCGSPVNFNFTFDQVQNALVWSTWLVHTQRYVLGSTNESSPSAPLLIENKGNLSIIIQQNLDPFMPNECADRRTQFYSVPITRDNGLYDGKKSSLGRVLVAQLDGKPPTACGIFYHYGKPDVASSCGSQFFMDNMSYKPGGQFRKHRRRF